ncbi:MAG TPA: shikimate kinase [Nitrospirota bacterium]|nr:shikimate kinase [Nitrospirota bacterium]
MLEREQLPLRHIFPHHRMTLHPSNIVLIGMPGSGKSTVGIILAKLLGKSFVDTDVLIQTQQGQSLRDIVDSSGYLFLRAIEERALLRLNINSHVIATGGSAVYSGAAMEHLKADGTVVFLNVDLETLKARVHDFSIRGLAKRPDQTVGDLFAERCALYWKHADIIIDCARLTHEEVCAKIVQELEKCMPH